jgi:hypothetical protein
MLRLNARILAGLLLLTAGSTAHADNPNSTGTTVRPVSATLNAVRVETRGERLCTGADGLYRFALETYEGTSSGDEEVDGHFVLQIHAFDNVTQGFRGPAVGTVTVYDRETGRVKLIADVIGVDSPSLDPPGVRVDGFVHGRVVGERDDDSGRGDTNAALFANFSAFLDPTAALVGNLGGDAPVPPHNTAIVVNRGNCAP